MRRILYIIVVLAIGILLALFLNNRRSSKEPDMQEPLETQVLELSSLLAYTSEIAPTTSVQTGRDVLPGGLMAAMVPGIIDWNRSRPEDGKGYAIIRNVNDGGNPLSGFTTLRSVLIPLASLRGAEFVLVPLDAFGKRGMVSHGQIRFLFDPENPVQILDEFGEPDKIVPPVEDLIFSWEAWRQPGVDFDVMVGMDSGAYELSLRVFTGRQRYLEDVLSKRDWYSTPLTLPGGHAGLIELFRVCAVMGDGIGRSTIGHMLDDAKEAWVQTDGPLQAGAEVLLAEWEELKGRIAESAEIDDSRMKLGLEDENYQSLIRSCATMALYTINVATERLKESQVPGADQVEIVPMPAIDEVPEWMSELAHVDLKGMFVRAPSALRYLRKYKAVVPTHIPGMLADAGLGAAENGKVVQIHYGQDERSPYGSAGLIR